MPYLEVADMRKLATWENLQPLKGTTSESADLDFKEMLDLKQNKIHIKCAKDVAALANVLGGHIVVGVSTDIGRDSLQVAHNDSPLVKAVT